MARKPFIARFRDAALLAICVALLAAQDKPDIQVDVDLVTVACAVDTRDGRPAGNLKAQDFKVLDNGQPREIRDFWQESDLPLTVALVADVSGSQAGYIRSHRETIAQFSNRLSTRGTVPWWSRWPRNPG